MNVSQTILLHDYFETTEGGGRLILELQKALRADLGCGFIVKGHPFFESFSDKSQVHIISSCSNIPLWRQYRLIQSYKLKTFFLKNYNTVIYSGFYSPLAIVNNTSGKNIYYCHTPPRYLYDQKEFYESLLPQWQLPFLRSFNRYYQPQYEHAINKMDCIIANSKNVKKRIATYLGLESTVIYPPCDTNFFHWIRKGNYFLSLARLDPLKRVDCIVKIFQKLPDKRLVVVSGGPDLARIKILSRGYSNIEVLGYVDEKQLQNYIGSCQATIYIPKDEDFGMSPVESMAAGKPVIGVAEGGLLETVVDGETGCLLPHDFTLDDLASAINRMTPEKALSMRQACVERAKQFDLSHFVESMKKIIEKQELTR